MEGFGDNDTRGVFCRKNSLNENFKKKEVIIGGKTKTAYRIGGGER